MGLQPTSEFCSRKAQRDNRIGLKENGSPLGETKNETKETKLKKTGESCSRQHSSIETRCESPIEEQKGHTRNRLKEDGRVLFGSKNERVET